MELRLIQALTYDFTSEIPLAKSHDADFLLCAGTVQHGPDRTRNRIEHCQRMEPLFLLYNKYLQHRCNAVFEMVPKYRVLVRPCCTCNK